MMQIINLITLVSGYCGTVWDNLALMFSKIFNKTRFQMMIVSVSKWALQKPANLHRCKHHITRGTANNWQSSNGLNRLVV